MTTTLFVLLLAPLWAQPTTMPPHRIIRRPPPPTVTGGIGVLTPMPQETPEPESKDPSLSPEWMKFLPGQTHRLPEAFFLRNQIRARLLTGVDAAQLEHVRRANRLAPASRDGLYLETYLRIFLEGDPVLHERRVEDARVSFLRFFEAFKYGDMEQALILFNTLPINVQDRFLVSLILGHHLLRYGVLDQSYQYFRRALSLLETLHSQFFGLRGTEKRNHYFFTLLSMAEIQLKSGQYRSAYGLLRWFDAGRLMAATDPLPCTWDQILARECPDKAEEFPSADHSWYTHDPEMLAFHRALLVWSRGWAEGPKAFEAFLRDHPRSMWAEPVRSYLNWMKTNTAP